MKIKEKILEIINEKSYRPLTREELVEKFDLSPSEYIYFFDTLNQMEKEGLVARTQRDKYILATSDHNVFTGVLQGSRSGGFCYFISDKDDTPDIFIPKEDLNGAIHKDRVMVQITKDAKNSRSPEGRVLKIIDFNDETIVGTFEEVKKYGFVKPDEQKYGFDIFIMAGDKNGAKNNDKVIVRLKRDGKKKGKNLEGTIVNILGHKKSKGIDITSIAYEFNLPFEFPKKALSQAKNIDQNVTNKEIESRQDFRDLLTVTIDGADAKDFDDAISIEKDKDDYILYVHIADVANYVAKGSSLDREAYKRGNSVYLLDRVIPMLPVELSNGICSLNPNVDRLTLTVRMRINKNGKVVDYKFYESVINSDFRLVYDNVSDYLEGKDDFYKDDELNKNLKTMEELYKILAEKRVVRGSIDFDFPEANIILDDKGVAVDVEKVERRVANKIIEEFMLVTNETVASHFGYMEMPFMYRIHEDPSEEKIAEFRKIIHNFGYKIKGQDIHSKDLQILLDEVKGKPEEQLISTILLRSMRKAEYSAEPDIHFGLATNYYTHFTSPIRRYPDLFIHRILKNWIHGDINIKNITAYEKLIQETAKHCSETERKAESAEYEVEDMKMAEYMESKIGAEYEGTIVSLTNYGMYIQLENTVEGLVRYESMKNDFYRFDEQKYYVIGDRTKKIYNLGEKVNIKVLDASSERREIDFIIVNKINNSGEEK